MTTTRSYHVGLVKAGNRLIVEVAATVDQLSCETWRYMGERQTTAARLHAIRPQILAAVNNDFGTKFTRVTVRLISDRDFTAGHRSVIA